MEVVAAFLPTSFAREPSAQNFRQLPRPSPKAFEDAPNEERESEEDRQRP